MRCFWPFKDLSAEARNFFSALISEVKPRIFQAMVRWLSFLMKRCFSAGETWSFGLSGSPQRTMSSCLKVLRTCSCRLFMSLSGRRRKDLFPGRPSWPGQQEDCGSRLKPVMKFMCRGFMGTFSNKRRQNNARQVFYSGSGIRT